VGGGYRDPRSHFLFRFLGPKNFEQFKASEGEVCRKRCKTSPGNQIFTPIKLVKKSPHFEHTQRKKLKFSGTVFCFAVKVKVFTFVCSSVSLQNMAGTAHASNV